MNSATRIDDVGLDDFQPVGGVNVRLPARSARTSATDMRRMLARRRMSPADGSQRGTGTSVNAAGPDELFGLAVRRQDRPERLMELLAVLGERPPKHALLDGAELPQCAGAAPVAQRRPRLEPVHAKSVEHEVERELRGVLEQPGAPVRRSDCETPFRRLERIVQLPDLDDA